MKLEECTKGTKVLITYNPNNMMDQDIMGVVMADANDAKKRVPVRYLEIWDGVEVTGGIPLDGMAIPTVEQCMYWARIYKKRALDFHELAKTLDPKETSLKRVFKKGKKVIIMGNINDERDEMIIGVVQGPINSSHRVPVRYLELESQLERVNEVPSIHLDMPLHADCKHWAKYYKLVTLGFRDYMKEQTCNSTDKSTTDPSE